MKSLAPARYILRFDDICPTLNWRNWYRIEPLLYKYKVKPLMAVVPNNEDPNLCVSNQRDDFWQLTRQWQQLGWSIGLHGYNHIYTTKNSGIMKLNSYSEFAGLTLQEQDSKIQKALSIFNSHGLKADAWVAPGHSFDVNTIKALLNNGVNVISDGFYARPVRKYGAIWVPQQLWHFRPLSHGVWTVCLHFNQYGEREIHRLEQWLSAYHSKIISLSEAIQDAGVRNANIFDAAFSTIFPIWRSIRSFKPGRWK